MGLLARPIRYLSQMRLASSDKGHPIRDFEANSGKWTCWGLAPPYVWAQNH